MASAVFWESGSPVSLGAGGAFQNGFDFMKKMILVIALILVAGAVWVMQGRRGATRGATPESVKARLVAVPVELTNVVVRPVPVGISTFGTVEPVTMIAVKSRITGLLAKAMIAEGQDVQAGDLLFEIDARGPQAALKQAEAVLARDRIQFENASKGADRQETLQKKGFVSLDVRDDAVTAAETLKAIVKADDALVETARLNLSYCSIRAPVTGRVGSLLLHQGNLVKADEDTLVTINQLDPILVRFALPQRELGRLTGGLAQGQLTAVALPVGTGVTAATGVVTFVDNAVDEKTGTIQVKARFSNAHSTLWPGQFVKVTLQFAVQEAAIVVPESAVLLGQQGAYVYVIDQAGRAMPRQIQVDRTESGLAVIASGLASGEVVVVDGQLRLKPGLLVKTSAGSKPELPSAGRP